MLSGHLPEARLSISSSILFLASVFSVERSSRRNVSPSSLGGMTISLAGMMVICGTTSIERWLTASKSRMLSIVSPRSSIRAGESLCGG